MEESFGCECLNNDEMSGNEMSLTSFGRAEPKDDLIFSDIFHKNYEYNNSNRPNILFSDKQNLDDFESFKDIIPPNTSANTDNNIQLGIKRKRDKENLGRKFDQDNIGKKIKISYLNSTLILLNLIIRKKMDENNKEFVLDSFPEKKKIFNKIYD